VTEKQLLQKLDHLHDQCARYPRMRSKIAPVIRRTESALLRKQAAR
jgi:hypothetical protein